MMFNFIRIILLAAFTGLLSGCAVWKALWGTVQTSYDVGKLQIEKETIEFQHELIERINYYQKEILKYQEKENKHPKHKKHMNKMRVKMDHFIKKVKKEAKRHKCGFRLGRFRCVKHEK